MKKLLFIILLLLLISCSGKNSYQKFCQIENSIYDNPKLSRKIVDSLQKTCDSTDETKMMYLRYLHFLLDDKLYVTHTNIPEIQEMVDFFEKSKDRRMLGRVYYALGRVASDLFWIKVLGEFSWWELY